MNGLLSPESLARLEPLNELGSSFLDRLIAKAHIKEIEKGSSLHSFDEHRWLLYLLQGEMTLVSNEHPGHISASSPRARRPLFSANRRKDYARADTACVIVRFERQFFESLRTSQNSSNYEIIDTPLSRTETAVASRIFHACMSGDLTIPSLPEIALRLREAIARDDVDANTLARIVQTDMAVTGGLIRAANSAMYGGMKPVTNVRDAIIRLGLDTTRKLATSLAMRHVFTSVSTALRQRMHRLWTHSIEIAALAHKIARLRPTLGLDAEEALLAGLLHDVGSIPVLDHIARHRIEIPEEEMDIVIRKLRPFVGDIVASHWGLDANIAVALKESENWLRDHQPLPDYCDVVIVAQAYALLGAGCDNDLPPIEAIPAFDKLAMGHLDDHARLEVIESARKEIAAVMDILGGS